MSPASTAATITGSILGLMRMMVGVPTVSSQPSARVCTVCKISTMVESRLVSCSNSRLSMEKFSEELEERVLILFKVAMACSRGLVMVLSTSSGAAPGAVVTMIT